MAKKQAFENLDGQYAAAANRGDAAAVANLYTKDALYLVPNGETVKGRNAIQSTAQEMIDAGMKNLKFSSVVHEVDGDLAYHVGKLSMDIPTGAGIHREKGKFVDIYKRQDDGSWKIQVTIYNSDLPVVDTGVTSTKTSPVHAKAAAL
jgi:uncharacterized protein (TIGR02246 family)